MVQGRHEAKGSAERQSGEYLRQVLESTSEAFVTMDAGGFVTDWNRAAEETFGWTRAQAIGEVLADLIVPARMRDAHWNGLRRYVETGEARVLGRRLELEALHCEGHEFPIEMTISALEFDGRPGFHAFIRDISERKRAEADREAHVERLESLARTDDLTGLWNRRGWDELLDRELARATREGVHLCVALLDLDGLKPFNDQQGHQAGDELLRAVARAWQGHLRATDVLARYGGDEFAVAFPAWPLGRAVQVVTRLRAAVPGDETCSAGLVAWDGEESADALVGRADKALYAAKRDGSNGIVVAG